MQVAQLAGMFLRLLCALALMSPTAAVADWYRWRDADGTVHVTDQLAGIPPAAAERIRRAPAAIAAPPAPPAAVGAVAPAAAAEAAAAPPSDAAAAAADVRRRRAARLADNRAHLALLRAAGRTDPASLAMENELADAVRADSEALR